MFDNNKLNEEQLKEAAGGGLDPGISDEATDILKNCLIKGVSYFERYDEKYPNVHNLYRYIRRAYLTDNYSDRIRQVYLCLLEVDNVINLQIGSDSSFFIWLKDELLKVQELIGKPF